MKIIEFAKKIAIQAGNIITEEAEKPLKIEEKGENDLVTNADKASEKFIIEQINKEYPKHQIIAEESFFENPNLDEKLKNAKYIWIIDPLDGTTNFSRDLPMYAVSIGIFKMKSAEKSKNFEYLQGELIAGVVYAPRLKELFWAEKGKGAYLNDKKIHVSRITKIEKSLTVTGFPPTHKERNMPNFNAMIHKARAVRRLGSAALDQCYVAAGRFDIFWEFGLKPWDIAAGAIIIKEAGGTVSDTNGNPLDLFGQDYLATNGKLHKKTIETFETL